MTSTICADEEKSWEIEKSSVGKHLEGSGHIHPKDVKAVTRGKPLEKDGAGITAAVMGGISDTLAVEEVVSMVEVSGN